MKYQRPPFTQDYQSDIAARAERTPASEKHLESQSLCVCVWGRTVC